MEDSDATSNTCTFRGHSYVVSVQVQHSDSLLVEVEDRLTANQWRATFDAHYIEDLTRKTGNYKQFQVFVDMLESAVNQNSDSVTLDLLTYSDLEALRKHKATSPKSTVPSAKATALNTKRYLILTYTVEFDRIHYPLPLPFVGTPDPTTLQDTVHQLREQVRLLKKQNNGHHKNSELHKLQKEYRLLEQDKADQDSSLVELSQALKHSGDGRAVKEVRALKAVIKNLEGELLREKTYYQRAANKRQKDYEVLLAEVEELRASERNLRVRVKSLTNELALLKRQSATSRRANTSHDRPSSFTRDRSLSRDRLPPVNRSASRDRLTNRSSSRERPISAPTSRSHDRSPFEWKPSFRRSRTPSPGVNKPRFDPTAYIKERERQRGEATLSRQRQTRTTAHHRTQASTERKSRLTPRGSNERNHVANRSRMSSGSRGGYSSDDIGLQSDSSYTALRISKRKNKQKPRLRTTNNSYITSPNTSVNSRRGSGDVRDDKLIASTPTSRPVVKQKALSNKENLTDNGKDGDFYDRSVEISEIDARLERLQKMMKTSLQCGT